MGLSRDDPADDFEKYCIGDPCLDHVVSRSSGWKRLAFESGLSPVSAAGNRAKRERTEALPVLGQHPFDPGGSDSPSCGVGLWDEASRAVTDDSGSDDDSGD